MARKAYPSDLTNAEWQMLEPLLPDEAPTGHPRKVDFREILKLCSSCFCSRDKLLFFYNLLSDQLLGGLKPLLTTHRDAVFIATGSESRHPDTLQRYLEQVRRSLDTNVIDAFFVEYLLPQDSANEVEVVQTQLQRWKTEGWVRYVGASTHNP